MQYQTKTNAKHPAQNSNQKIIKPQINTYNANQKFNTKITSGNFRNNFPRPLKSHRYSTLLQDMQKMETNYRKYVCR